MQDPTEFRRRFKEYKDGGKPYENGRPRAIQQVDDSDADFAKRLKSNWRQEIWDWERSGKAVTHKIAGEDNIIYPNVLTTKGGGLIDFTNPIWQGNVDPLERAIKNNDYVPMKTESDAIWFGPNYKDYYPGFKNGKLPRYKIGHNVSNAKLNEDGTFTDDYTKVFEDMYVTPQKTDLKRGSYTLNNFPYYLQHRIDWTKPFMSSATNEKGLETISPEFDLLLGGRQLATELIPTKIRPITKLYDNAWDRHYFKALLENDLKGAENLREAHFRVKAPNTKIKERLYHSVSDEYNPNFNSFDTKASGVESSIYTTDDPIMSGNYTKELVSEKELNNIIEETRLEYIYKLAKNRPWTREGTPFFMDDRYWTYANPKKAKAQILKDFKWLNNPIHPERQKQLYVNLENPFIIDAKNKYWSHFDYEDFPKNIQNVIRADMGSDIYHPYTTRSIERAQKLLGYDGAIINNVIDYGGRKQFMRRLTPANVIQINNPKNIKYADAIVYDDSGNIIPLSLRDNFEINDLRFKDGKLPGYKDGKIHIKPANRGKFTALKKRTGHSASWFKENGTPEQKKMAIFALNAKKWKH